MKVKRKARRTKAVLILGILITAALLAAVCWYWYDNTVDRGGWYEKNGSTYYLDFHGKPLAGWLEIDGSRYYFGADGAMVSGWQELDGSTFYFDENGALASGWRDIGTERFYLSPSGNPVSGWRDIDGQRFFFTDRGTPVVGWMELDSGTYYFGSDGTMVTGWLELEDGKRYLAGDGTLVTGLCALEDGLYRFEDSGVMYIGWLDGDEGRSYFTESGPMAVGWMELDGKRYHFSEDGVMDTGWYEEGEYRYYFLPDGSAATSPTEIDGEMCFFSPKGIYVLLVNYQYPVPKGYDPDLVRYGNSWSRVCQVAYEPLQRMIADCQASGVSVWLNCAYRTQKEQTTILDDRTDEYTAQGMTWAQARAKALETVAVPGYSEHQLGLAMDIVCSQLTDWLIEHCWEYGFILRYPEGKADITHIVYEHWHFRYVGTEVSMDMKDTGLCLEEYLGAA